MSNEKKSEIINKISDMDNKKLLQTYVYYIQNFNPIDFDMCNTYEIVMNEILNRMDSSNTAQDETNNAPCDNYGMCAGASCSNFPRCQGWTN